MIKYDNILSYRGKAQHKFPKQASKLFNAVVVHIEDKQLIKEIRTPTILFVDSDTQYLGGEFDPRGSGVIRLYDVTEDNLQTAAYVLMHEYGHHLDRASLYKLHKYKNIYVFGLNVIYIEIVAWYYGYHEFKCYMNIKDKLSYFANAVICVGGYVKGFFVNSREFFSNTWA